MARSVKSAERVLSVLEYLAECRHPVRVSDVSSALGFPQSSTSILLHNLKERGYLYFDSENRVFSPTLRISVLGGWLVESDRVPFNPLRLMRDLREKTGQAIVLGVQNGCHALYINVLGATASPGHYRSPGSMRPLCRCAIGQALLTKKSDSEIGLLVRRINAERPPHERTERLDEVLEAVHGARDLGYATTLGSATPDAGVVAIPLTSIEGQPPLAIGIGAPLAQIRSHADEYGQLLLNSVKSLKR